MKQTHSTTKLLAAAIFELIIAIDLLFPTWLGMDVYLASGSASLWRVGKLMSTLANYAGSDSNFLYTLISIIIYILLVLSLVAVVLTGRSLYQAYKKKDTPVKMAGFVIPAVLSVLVILVVVIGNAIVSSESDGWITSVFFLKGAPIINLILAVLGILLLKKAPDAAFASADQKLQSAGTTVSEAGKAAAAAAARPAAAQARKCPSCGAVCSDRNAVFCPTCGSKLSQTVKCSDCGKELPAYTKFCPYCGKPVQNTRAAANNGGAEQ